MSDNHFDFKISDATKSLNDFLRECHHLYNSLVANKDLLLILDFREIDFIYPNYAVQLIALIREIGNKREQSVNGSIRINKRSEVFKYLYQIDFFKHLSLEIKDVKKNYNKNNTIEIRENTDQNHFDNVEELKKILFNNCKINENVLTSLDYCFNEILENIERHSENEYGYFVVQNYKTINQLRICVVDTGIGIHNALNGKFDNEKESLLNCIIEGVTNGKGQGHGLYAASVFIKENQGVMKIISGNYTLEVDKNNSKIVESPYWQGTCIILDINTNISVNYKLFTSRHFDQKEEMFESLFEN